MAVRELCRDVSVSTEERGELAPQTARGNEDHGSEATLDEDP